MPSVKRTGRGILFSIESLVDSPPKILSRTDTVSADGVSNAETWFAPEDTGNAGEDIMSVWNGTLSSVMEVAAAGGGDAGETK